MAERMPFLRQYKREQLAGGLDEKLGTKRLQRWQSQPQFTVDSLLAQRLGADGLDEAALFQLLSLPEEGIYQITSEPPPWVSRLRAAYAQPASSYVNILPGEEELGFLELVQPLVDQACDELAAATADILDQWPQNPVDPQIIEDILLMNLLDPLLLRLSRTLVLELNVARLQGYLAGDTALERFLNFVEGLRQPEIALGILDEYPVLAQQLTLCIDQWRGVSLEFLGRLCADWPEICAHFTPDTDPGFLQEVSGGAGDTHRNGRSVMIARFSSGFQIVYKPKSLAVDSHFQELLGWLNERGCQPALRPITMLDRQEYGWVEYVQNRECSSAAGIERFYLRLGSYLAMLYAINASDFHLENLIADGGQPLLIDLETLFNPNFERFTEEDANTAAAREMINSVLAVGMLPQRLWSAEEYGGIDISGFGGAEGQLSPDRLPLPAAVGTDSMHYERRRVAISGEANRPRFQGVEANALEYIPQVLTGFEAMYHLLQAHKQELLAPDGPLAAFENDEIRVLIRPTRTYDQLLFESFHPDTLRDALDRELLFDRLWVAANQRPFMAKLINAEKGDLLQGDIPVFTTQPGSVMLNTASGEPTAGVLIESGMDIARRRLEQMSDRDLERQEWFIRSSLATLTPYSYGAEFSESAKTPKRQPAKQPDKEELLALARDAADHLLQTAVYGQEDVTWLGLELLAEESWDIAPAGMDLANGLPGIALFLGYAGTLLDNSQYSAMARRALVAVQRHMNQFKSELPGIGAFVGWGGILYCLTQLSALRQDEELLAQAEELVAVIAQFIAEDDAYSVSEGAAGAIGALLALYKMQPVPEIMETAAACGDHLLANAQRSDQGLGWLIPRFGSQPLTGFAYGSAGIAWALLELGTLCGEERFTAAALEAINYERHHFSPQAQNWPDLRQKQDRAEGPDQGPRYPAAWSFGAAGIGLSRIRALTHVDEPTLHDEIDIAIQTTLKSGFGHNHCLNHGDLGNIELFLQAEQLAGGSICGPQRASIGAMIVESIRKNGRKSGGPQAVEMPGLLLGTAGIGYQLLRLAEPDCVPSLLLLGSPLPK